MHINSGNMILFQKSAQELQNVETPDILSDREITRAIRDAIIAEEGAIKQYEVVADSCDNGKVKKVLQKIANEEKVHVGELQKLLNDILPDEEGFLEDGAKEVSDIDEDKEDEEEMTDIDVEVEAEEE